jgi:hypothetical protein
MNLMEQDGKVISSNGSFRLSAAQVCVHENQVGSRAATEGCPS